MNTVGSVDARINEHLFYLLPAIEQPLRDDVLLALCGVSRSLHEQKTEVALDTKLYDSWTLLVYSLIESLNSSTPIHHLMNTAIAIRGYICALDIFDDIEDMDYSNFIQKVGISKALNTATALLFLSEHALSSLSEKGMPPEQVLRMLSALHRSALQATSGQHKDLFTENDSLQTFSTDACLAMAAEKSGSGLQVTFQLGAICAGTSEKVFEKLSECGMLYGIAKQLNKDAHDIHRIIHNEELQEETGSNVIDIKSDIAKNKKTLPLVLAAQELHVDTLQELLDHVDTRGRVLEALNNSIAATYGVSLHYKEQAEQILRSVEDGFVLSDEVLEWLRL